MDGTIALSRDWPEIYAKVKIPTLSLQKAQGQEWGTRHSGSLTTYTRP